MGRDPGYGERDHQNHVEIWPEVLSEVWPEGFVPSMSELKPPATQRQLSAGLRCPWPCIEFVIVVVSLGVCWLWRVLGISGVALVRTGATLVVDAHIPWLFGSGVGYCELCTVCGWCSLGRY